MARTIHYQVYLAKHARKSFIPLACIAGLVRVTIPHVLCVETSSEATVSPWNMARPLLRGWFEIQNTPPPPVKQHFENKERGVACNLSGRLMLLKPVS